MRHALPLLMTLALLPAAACAGRGSGTSTTPEGDTAAAAAAAGAEQQRRPRPPRSRADMITREEIERTDYNNAYELVEALRNNWLQPRGTDTFFGKPGEVRVRVDNNEFGGVERLREIALSTVDYVRFVDPVDAAGRWGIGYGHGAIHVVTRTR